MNAHINYNNDHNGIEISFDKKPNRETLDALKSAGFRWHNLSKVWYAKQSKKTTQFAAELLGGKAPAKQNDQNHIRIYWNGIKIDGGSLIRCGYSLNNNATHSPEVSIYCRDYSGDLPRDLFDVHNDTDIYTDYFDKDSAYLTPEHPLYKYFRYAAIKARAHDDKLAIAHRQNRIKSGKVRNDLIDFYNKEIAEATERIAEADKAIDPGQPTAADLEAIKRERQKRENARKEAERAESLRRAEEERNRRVNGRRLIVDTEKAHPITDNAPVVRIEWSEHPAFYDYEDGALVLSLEAAEIILRTLDDEEHGKDCGYFKTKFTIIDGENTYTGRYDLGDGDGGLIQHIRSLGDWYATHDNHGHDKPERDETNDYLKWADRLTSIAAPDLSPFYEPIVKDFAD